MAETIVPLSNVYQQLGIQKFRKQFLVYGAGKSKIYSLN